MADRKSQPAHQPTPTHNSSTPVWTDLPYADAVADCPTHRAQHEQAEARYAEFSAANGASTARRDRCQLGLQLAKRTAVTA